MSYYERVAIEDSQTSPLIGLEETRDTLAEMPSFRQGRQRRRRELLGSAAMPKRAKPDNWEGDDLMQNQQLNHIENKYQYVDMDLGGTATPLSDKGFMGDTTLDYSTAEQLTSMQDLQQKDVDALSLADSDDQATFVKYAKLILPHVGLVLLTCTYTLIGASIFYSIEGPHEHEIKTRELTHIAQQRDTFLQLMWQKARNGSSASFTDWRADGTEMMIGISDELFEAFSKHFLTAKEVRYNKTNELWTFQTSIFFAVTVVTTIGYGYPVPVTTAGRLCCVVFALFGIPLTLVTIADIGKFFSEHLIWSYKKYYILKKRLKGWCTRQRVRWSNHNNTLQQQQQHHGSHDGEQCHDEHHVCEHCRECEIDPDLIGIEQRIPATLVLAIMLAYTAFGGFLMSELEQKWSFLASFYYSFITMTTVGFGDLIPKRDGYLWMILLYIVLGLAITTMCIDLVGVQYIRKIHYFGRKLQDAKSAFAIVGGKVVLVSELYGRLHRRGRDGRMALLFPDGVHPHLVPYIPRDIRRIRWIDREYTAGGDSLSTSTSSMEFHSCKYCHHHRYTNAGNTNTLNTLTDTH